MTQKKSNIGLFAAFLIAGSLLVGSVSFAANAEQVNNQQQAKISYVVQNNDLAQCNSKKKAEACDKKKKESCEKEEQS